MLLLLSSSILMQDDRPLEMSDVMINDMYGACNLSMEVKGLAILFFGYMYTSTKRNTYTVNIY